MTRQVLVQGFGLHTGLPSQVVLSAKEGPVSLRAGGVEVNLDDLEVASTERATTVQARAGTLRVRTVEHAFGALAGLGLYGGVAVALEGSEMPLLDGGATAWCDALEQLEIVPTKPRLRIARAGHVGVGASRYEFVPGSAVDVEVRLQFDDPRISEHASWGGDRADFRTRIAPARTFALAHQVEELVQRRLVRHVDPASVVLIAPEAIHCAGRTFSSDEPARHKLLDLIGDLYLYGGPPVGRVRAFRPGHAANAYAMRVALSDGLVVAVGP